MAKIAIVEPKPTKNDYVQLFENSFSFDLYRLCSNPGIKRILKKDVDIEFNPDDYDWVILIGSEPTKQYSGMTSVTEYSGRVVKDKFIPCINPAMLAFNPGSKPLWEESKRNVIRFVSGDLISGTNDPNVEILGIRDSKEAAEYLRGALDPKYEYVAFDSETSALYPRDGYILGISISYAPKSCAYIESEALDEECEDLLLEIFAKKKIVFQNAKFDLKFFLYHLGLCKDTFDDTMLMHYCLDETPGSHGLKSLALRFTRYGDYEAELKDFIDRYVKEHRILKSQFSYAMIPFDIISTYAAMDALVTLELFHIFRKSIDKNPKLWKPYNELLIPGTRFLVDVEENGIPFSRERLEKSQKLVTQKLIDAREKLHSFDEVERFIQVNGEFNPNSVVQLRKLLFDYLGLTPVPGKLTGKGEISTDKEVLTILSKEHPVVAIILEIRQLGKIKNTYLDKLVTQLDSDDRVRTGFNLHVTTSGRLSSSGKVNAQQFPRDDPIVKGCIQAQPGYDIISMDLKTAEMYIAAALSKDKRLQDIFRSGKDMHSSTAKEVFGLSCEVEEVATLFKEERQATKAINFGILYGAAAFTICDSIYKDTGQTVDIHRMTEIIAEYFKRFSGLDKWIKSNRKFIATNGFIYSAFGRKRRLPNVNSNNRGVSSHEIRSGLNFLIQSVASDVNLFAGIQMNEWIKNRGFDAKIFGLVHDSILAEVRSDLAEEYCNQLKFFVQLDRGVSISGAPIGCDFEIGNDYSFGKYEKVYG